MRLKSIKLAGFKSFVDPTTVPFPTNMSAIVGPNGCGKSNIIDAVRWVMGESSAKHLRGESMTDVIFNGSNARKPVGQASIELVFDNSDGSAPGEYASYAEISVKRRVSRDAQSDYFLNNTRCRRRDITDLFLGTGLGPRSYAIIEQGMISRLIEAKPEELRIYIEEAAGISKYKERRKETESRMRRTRENLERLNDLREELERQLNHLERQAQAAEKYKTYKQDERQKKAELAALRWQALDNELQRQRVQLRELELTLEKGLTERISVETRLEGLRDEHQERNEHFNRAQARFYEAGADIARVEQSLQHQKERVRQMAVELEQALSNQRELDRELEQDELRLSEVEAELEELRPELEIQRETAEDYTERLAQAEQRMGDWQQRWEQFSQRAADVRQQAEVEQSRIRSGEETVRRLQDRQNRLREESELLRDQIDREELAELRESLELARDEREQAQAEIDQLGDDLQAARQHLIEDEHALAEARERREELKGRLASQKALLEEQLGDTNEALMNWLERAGWQSRPRLAQRLEVRDGWSKAVETVLGPWLQGTALDDGSSLDESLLASAPAGLALITDVESQEGSPDSLAACVGNAGALSALLSSVITVGSLAEALKRRETLAEDASLITPEGVWLGRNWLRMPTTEAGHTGVIERQKMVAELEQLLAELQGSVSAMEAGVEQAREQVRGLELRRDEQRRQLSDSEQRVSTAQSRLGALEARAEQIEVRLGRIQDDLEEVAEQLLLEEERLAEARGIWDEAMAGMASNADDKEGLLRERDDIRSQLDDLRQQARHSRDHAHQLQLQVQALANQRDGLRQTRDRMSLQRERLDERVAVLQEGREGAQAPIEDLALELEGLLERRLMEEDRLATARDALEELDRQVRELDQARSQAEQAIQGTRDRQQALKMEVQALEIRSTNILEQLTELDVQLKAVLETMPAEAEVETWEAELERLAQRVQRLGAINLAAIDEYRVQGERKRYLDEQHADLTEALETLESAIRKIDRETRQRFKETFDEVNGGLQSLFPKVFGGGSAYLELTGEDLLETGVTIMARPPGKKNSTIHLLSGGEKALTAIALVFSIFRLNPAPFCMLDEVDAPLDDANVGRYATMVKEMSQHLQFIYITHNKIAMEMADQLMGVTMHEPGVSRLVSVDVEEAAALAAV
ncbi:chromosome segregation protein SMC [Mangrovitalea sediminis]|uniref:chromosome segregation protein SMC n=1 Tax=Mangrovitalea sediminis TaxID=1982043 RepID=UPI000BE5ABAC|nr:chromosome segregation protein SMC [Mangrovitalea sediminis]